MFYPKAVIETEVPETDSEESSESGENNDLNSSLDASFAEQENYDSCDSMYVHDGNSTATNQEDGHLAVVEERCKCCVIL